MGIEENIDGLFEEAKKEEDIKKEIRDIHEGDLEKIELGKDAADDEGGLERREFSRIDLEEKHIAIAFNSEMQFAKHYIQNISIGGLFVKTSDKFQFGELIPIQFKVKNEKDDSEEHFVLKGRVCRIIETGVGLEFTNLDDQTRTRLEKYVRSVLPNGAEIRTQAKQSTIQRLKEIREKKYEASQKRKKIGFQVVAMASMLVLNAVLVTEVVKEEANSLASERKQTVTLNGSSVEVNQIKSLQKDQNGQFQFTLEDGRIVIPDPKDIDQSMPRQIRSQIKVLQTKKTKPQKRKSLNNSRVRLR